MFSLTVLVGPSGMAWGFMFKTKETADKAMADLRPHTPAVNLSINDDFGQSASFRDGQINAVLLDDMDKSMDAHIERGIHNARTQAEGNRRAQQDTKLRTAAMMGAGPMIVGPGGSRA